MHSVVGQKVRRNKGPRVLFWGCFAIIIMMSGLEGREQAYTPPHHDPELGHERIKSKLQGSKSSIYHAIAKLDAIRPLTMKLSVHLSSSAVRTD